MQQAKNSTRGDETDQQPKTEATKGDKSWK